MIKNKKVALLYGGYSSEREISIKSGKAVENSLKKLSLNYKVFDPINREKFIKELTEFNPDVVFIALHGKGGEDGTIQGVLEFLGYKYTGSGIKASSIAMDKAITKDILKNYDIPMANWMVLNDNDGINILNEKLKKLNNRFPKVVKPSEEGSSIGVNIVNSKDDLIEAVKNSFKYGKKVLVEDFIKGREITVGILNGEPLEIVEIKVISGFYDFKNKYLSDETEYICPAEIEDSLYKGIQKIAVDIYSIIGCKGAVRVDFILGEDKIPYFLEINTIPGMTDHSLLPKAAKVKGIDFDNLILKILEDGLNA